MNPKIKAKWVKALRSGDYKQGRLRLRKKDKFCCLGVLCNLHAQAHPAIAAKEKSPETYLGNIAVLPGLVEKWSGVYVTYDLTTKNDGTEGEKKHNFNQIADYIEKHL